MENLHRHNTCGIVLSWALQGQGGTGHVNEQNNDYVKAKICAKGYVNDVDAEQALRQASRFSYFKKTIMVFRRMAPAAIVPAHNGDASLMEKCCSVA